MQAHHALERRPRKTAISFLLLPRGYGRGGTEIILKFFYHWTVHVLPPVLGLRHEKIQNSLSAPQSARCSLLRPARSNGARPSHPARPASLLICRRRPAAADAAKGVRFHHRQEGLGVSGRDARCGVRP